MKKAVSFILALALILPCLSMCTVFADNATTGNIYGASLDLGSSLTVNYYAKLTGEANGVQMCFTSSSGRKTTVNGNYDPGCGMYKFPYTGINPQCMSDTINAQLVLDGETLATYNGYSVKQYCDDLMSSTPDDLHYSVAQYEALKPLLADMLEYGFTSQEYVGYHTETPANDLAWVNSFKSDFETPEGTRTFSNTDANNKIRSVTLHIANVNKICFKLILADETVEVVLNGKTVSRSDLENNNDGSYSLYTEDLVATEFDKIYTLELIKDTKVISTVSYNMYAYIQMKYQDSKVGDIARALYNYGVSAKAFFNAMNKTDDDFELDDDDDFSAESLVTGANSTFEGVTNVSQLKWEASDPVISLSLESEDGNQFLAATRSAGHNNYETPRINLANYIFKSGVYKISFRYKVYGAPEGQNAFNCIIRTQGETSFSEQHGNNYYDGLSISGVCNDDVWYTHTEELEVLATDCGRGGKWNFGFHNIHNSISKICIDDFVVSEITVADAAPNKITQAETWVANELVLHSTKAYARPFYDVTLDLELTNGNDTYTVPGFWDGGNTWRVRFTCPTAGQWTYTTVCSDTSNAGLHGQSGTVNCTAYTGDLDVYTHGHVKVTDGQKYFTYADNTPFFYLGDTHWNLGAEPLDMIQTVIEKRVEQGFTVWQSEPLGAGFNFANGINVSDIEGLRSLDAKYKAIADAGLTHVNASFFYPSNMLTFIENHGGFSDTPMDEKAIRVENGQNIEYDMYDLSENAKTELERICRYWVARYSAYPVMWSLGQEVDDDFFWQRENYNGHEKWSYVNNPYRYVAEYIAQYDPYNSPVTAHMEGTNNTNGISGSSFGDLEAHDFYALQWSPSLTDESAETAYFAKQAWDSSEKPVIEYEGRYCYLWTKNFGARAQGWIAYLSGMYGYGWGGQGTWNYLGTYDENSNSPDGVDTVTPEEKQNATWQNSLEYASAYQAGYMRSFFENTVGDWWNLIPRFADENYLKRSDGALATVASNEDNSKTVIYFFNFTDTSVAADPNSSNGTATGTLKNLESNTTYHYQWFNPITGEITAPAELKTNSLNSWSGTQLPPKPAGTDYVLYIYK